MRHRRPRPERLTAVGVALRLAVARSRHPRLVELVEEMREIGFEELVAFWPWDDDQREVFERDAGEIAAHERLTSE